MNPLQHFIKTKTNSNSYKNIFKDFISGDKLIPIYRGVSNREAKKIATNKKLVLQPKYIGDGSDGLHFTRNIETARGYGSSGKVVVALTDIQTRPIPGYREEDAKLLLQKLPRKQTIHHYEIEDGKVKDIRWTNPHIETHSLMHETNIVVRPLPRDKEGSGIHDKKTLLLDDPKFVAIQEPQSQRHRDIHKNKYTSYANTHPEYRQKQEQSNISQALSWIPTQTPIERKTDYKKGKLVETIPKIDLISGNFMPNVLSAPPIIPANIPRMDTISKGMVMIRGKDLPIQEHLGTTQLTSDMRGPYLKYAGQETLSVGKPRGGFWTSSLTPGGHTDWKKLLKTNDTMKIVMTDPKTRKELIIQPNPNAKIFQIDTYKDVKTLYDKYPYEVYGGEMDKYGGWKNPPIKDIDWIRVAKDYDAVNITEKAANKLIFGTPAAGGKNPWDVESTVWFNPAFKEIPKPAPVITIPPRLQPPTTEYPKIDLKSPSMAIFYHGTTAMAAPHILRSGVKTSRKVAKEWKKMGIKRDPRMSDETDIDKTYVFKDKEDANNWAQIVARAEKFPPAIIEVDIPEEKLERDFQMKYGSAYSHKGNIPATAITGVVYRPKLEKAPVIEYPKIDLKGEKD